MRTTISGDRKLGAPPPAGDPETLKRLREVFAELQEAEGRYQDLADRLSMSCDRVRLAREAVQEVLALIDRRTRRANTRRVRDAAVTYVAGLHLFGGEP